MPVLTNPELVCPGMISYGYIERLLASRERTQRFTGIKLARLNESIEYRETVREMINDQEEDIYVRLEGVSYLSSVCEESTRTLFTPFLNDQDPQNRLEATIALGETATHESIEVLGEILNDSCQPEFMRSASAWALGKIGTERAQHLLVHAFADVNKSLREEALENIIGIGVASLDVLVEGLRQNDEDIAAGCAEALRQCEPIPLNVLEDLVHDLIENNRSKVSLYGLFGCLGIGQLSLLRLQLLGYKMQDQNCIMQCQFSGHS
jgi:hypothetical protein